MFRYLAKNKGILILALVVLACFLWMSSQVREPGKASLLERGVGGAAYPFVKAISYVGSSVKGVWNGYFNLVGLVKENARLKEYGGRLFQENTRLKEGLLKCSRADKLLAFKEQSGFGVIAAGVVGRDATSWFKSVWVDAGLSDGVMKNMPAMAGGGLVGRVLKQYPGTSRVLLITDPDSAVSCIIERSRDTGILVGQGSDLCRLQYVANHAEVVVGDLVVASGLDGVYPKGLPVGVVVKVTKAASGYFQDVQVRPSADLGRLEELLIIKYVPPEMPAETHIAPVKRGR
jgi:rod shape-determining protein MreC